MSLRLRIATAAVVGALALAGCGASSSAPQATQQTTSGPSTAASPLANHHQAAPAKHHSHTSAAEPSAGKHHPSTSSSSSIAPTPKTSVSSGSSGSSSASPTGPAPVAPGTYTYSQTGSQKAAGFTSSVPATSSLVVAKATSNGEQTSEQKAGGKEGSEQTLQFTSKGMFLVSEVEQVPLPGHAETITCHFKPGVPYPPWPVTIGAKAQAHTDCGPVDVTAKGVVTGRRTTTVGAVKLTVYVVTVTLTTSGQISSTSTDTEWFAPSLRLVVRDASTINGKYGPFGFSGSFTRTLTSTTPH